MKILITGSTGQLGQCLNDKIPRDWIRFLFDSSMLNITDEQQVMDVVKELNPDVIVNCAAYTAVDKAEVDEEHADSVNSSGPSNLASAAKCVGAKFIHISTDYVFNGLSSIPYKESDETDPLGVYGRTKLKGEKRVVEILPEAVVIRTAWVFSEYGNNFLKTMLRLGQDRDVLGVVSDQYGCPTYAGDIAKAIISLIDANAGGGIYHYCGNSTVSWHQFAEEIFRQAVEQNKLVRAPVVNAITTEQYPTPAARPAFSTLSTEKIQQLGIQPSDWQSAISTVLGKL